MTEIHAFDPDGTPSPGAQTALDEAVTGLATTADVTAQIGAATEGLASEVFVADTVAAIPDATTEQRGLMSAADKAAVGAINRPAPESTAVARADLDVNAWVGRVGNACKIGRAHV